MVGNAEYVYFRTEVNDIVECDCCGAEVPTRCYPTKSSDREVWHFCQLCDSMSMSIHVQYKGTGEIQNSKPATLPDIAKLLNLAIDVITGRKN